MSLLFNVLFAWKCKSTHHKLALDALTLLRGPDAERWRNLFLKNVEPYLEGSKAPDDRFKDFRNHVLHVAENRWGGAPAAVTQWYDMTVESLRAKDWPTGIYRAGVLSHYYTDPVQPFHTGQSDAEGNIHRAAEWSIAQGYDELKRILLDDLGGFPDVPVPAGDDWLVKMVIAGAEAAHPHYQPLIDHYDVHVGVKNPPAGMDQEFKDRIARLIGHAASGFARILERAFADADASPPETSITLDGILSALAIPIHFVTKRMADAQERAIVLEAYQELQETGRVKAALSEDDRTIRKLHTTEVLKTTEAALDQKPAGPTGAKFGSGAAPRGATARPRVSSTRIATKIESAPIPERAAKSVRSETVERAAPTPVAKAASIELPREKAPVPASAPARQPVAESPPKPPVNPPAAPKTIEPKRAEPKIEEPAPVVASKPIVAVTEARKELEPRAPVVKPQTPLMTLAADVESTRRTEDAEDADEDFDARRESVPALPARPAVVESSEEPTSRAPSKKAAAATGRAPRFYLEMDSPIVDAPSIGQKTADRLNAVGIITVADFLDADVDALAAKLNQRHLAADVLREWQQQAALMVRVPELRGHDVQILVACGITEPEDLLSAKPEDLMDLVDTFCSSPEGQRVLRDSQPPDLDEIHEWITAAAQSRPFEASSGGAARAA